MDVYVLFDAFDEGHTKILLGVFESLDKAYDAAFYILRERKVFEPLKLKKSTKNDNVWLVVNEFGNVWNYIFKKELNKI